MWRPMWCVALLLLPELAIGRCPSQCVCDDKLLEATCVDTALEVVPIQLNPELKIISLRDNKIINVHYTLEIYTNLRTLDVSQNRITSLGSNNFELQDKLLNLNLSSNLIGNLSKDTFKGLKKLRVLDLSNNHLELLEGNVFSSLPNLVELHVVNNRILDIGINVFDKLNSLLVLRLDKNELLDVPTACLKHLNNLEILGLGANLIENIEENATPMLSNLIELILNGNIIKEIDRAAFGGLTSLEYLHLNDNNLTSIPTESLSKLKNLTYLDLSGNGFQILKPVAFQSLFKLQRVKLSRLVRLRKIDVRTFVDNIKLERIEMDDNKNLIALPWRLFHGNPLLTDVSICDSGLMSLDASHFPLDQLSTLSLGGSLLHCNCSLLWLWQLAHNQVEAGATVGNTTSSAEVTPLLDVADIRCASPQAWRGVLLSEVPDQVVHCDSSLLAILLVGVAVSLLALVACVLLVVRCRSRAKPSMDRIDPPHSHKGAVMRLLGQEEGLHPNDVAFNKPKHVVYV